MFKQFNNLLALVVLVLIFGFWLVQGFGLISVQGEINGALVVAFTLVVQFYFRKAQEEKH